MKPNPTSVLIAVITNHGCLQVRGETRGASGIGIFRFPEASPSGVYRITIERIGVDPSIKPELHAFIPNSQFGTKFIDYEKTVRNIAEEKTALRKRTGFKKWHQLRLQKLQIDLKNYRKSVLTHRLALRQWKRECRSNPA